MNSSHRMETPLFPPLVSLLVRFHPEDSKHPRKFTFRINPRDMREIYFRDPANNSYIPIPYRDRTRPPASRWEIQAAEKRLERV